MEVKSSLSLSCFCPFSLYSILSLSILPLSLFLSNSSKIRESEKIRMKRVEGNEE